MSGPRATRGGACSEVRSRIERIRPLVAFTLLELLVSLSILSLLVLLLFGVIRNTMSLWTRSIDSIAAFQDARLASEDIARTISKATLNTYWTYIDGNGDENFDNPVEYAPFSNLRFRIGNGVDLLPFASPTAARYPGQAIFFQAPLGRAADSYSNNRSLLNTLGYYIEYDKERDVPDFIETLNLSPDRYRYRLMRMLQPSQKLLVFQNNASDAWFQEPIIESSPVHALAENVIALVILPQLPASEDPSGTALVEGNTPPNSYAYDSIAKLSYTIDGKTSRTRHQLPPLVQITLVALEESTMKRLDSGQTPPDLGIDLGTLFQDATKYKEDLKDLEDALTQRKLGYRVFTTKVAINGAKWSVE